MASTLDLIALRGDTFDELPFTIEIDGQPWDISSATILMQLRSAVDGTVALALSVGSGLTITNGAAGQFKINQQIISIAYGNYLYDIQVTIGGWPYTYISGNFSVVGDISHA